MAESHEERFMGDLLAPEIGELIEQRQNHQARMALQGLLDPEIADVLMALAPRHRAVAFRLLPRDTAADVFVLLPEEQQEQLLRELNDQQLAHLFNEIDPDDRAELFEEMPGELVKKLLWLMEPQERRLTQIVLGYPEQSVGRFMTPEYLTIRPQWTVQDALDHIREQGEQAETLNVLYMVDEKGRLFDFVQLHDLLTAEPNLRCEGLRHGHVVSLHAGDDREVAVRVMKRYDLPVLPVVDRDGMLVGIVTFDDVADVAEEEVTEDMHKFGGMEALDGSYLASSVFVLVRKRAIWLAVLFAGGLLTVSAMGMFEQSIKKYAILALFVPLIIASGGNSGSQAASLMIRSLAIGEVTLADWARVMRREVLSGLMLGTLLGLMGLVVGTLAGLWMLEADVSFARAIHFGLAIGTSLIGVVLIGTLSGSMLPFALQGLGLDPATSSTPFVATIADVTGIIVYFLVALVILGI